MMRRRSISVSSFDEGLFSIESSRKKRDEDADGELRHWEAGAVSAVTRSATR